MSALPLTITSAGFAALVNAQATGSAGVLIAQIGLANAPFVAAATLTALPHELKRLASFGGGAVDPATIHISMRDDSADAYELFGFGLFLNDGTLFAVYSQDVRILGKAAISQTLLSFDIRLSEAVAGAIVFGDTAFLDPPATTERAGLVELATLAETLAGADTVRAVTPASLKAAIDGVIDGAPGALNTLKELAQSLANNPDLAGTMTTQLALKAPLASPALTGAPTATTPAGGDNSLRIATTAWAGADATAKANTARDAAIGTAAIDATNKSDAARTTAQAYADVRKGEAIAAAAADATAKDNSVRTDLAAYAEARKAEAITAAATDATAKANAAQTAAQGYADARKAEAIAAAAADATAKDNSVRTDLAGFAETKKAEAIAAASADATAKANAAQGAAQAYADARKAEAIAAASADATAKDNVQRGDLVGYTDAAKANAIAVAAADATAKANAAQAAAIGTASADATGKANAAQAAAIAAVLAMFTGGNQSLASPGFQVFPGGFTVQWGEVSEMVTGDGLFSPVAFPQAFANTCFAVLPTSLNAGNSANADALPNIVSHSATGFNARSNTTSGVAFVTGFAWIAVGF